MALEEWITLNFSTTGPFDLKRTIESGHSSFPIPLIDKWDRYNMVITVPASPKKVLARISQPGKRLKVDIATPGNDLSDNEIKKLRKLFRQMFGLNVNLFKFFEEFKDDPIAPAFKKRAGVRLTLAHDLFESLICSIMTQRNSVWRWNGQIRKIKELLGEKYPADHFMIHSFPEAKVLFRNKHQLRQAKLGYREDYVIGAAEYIANQQIRLEKLRKLSTDEAKKTIRQIKGVGEKVADMFLLYGLGKINVPPTDVWIQRGVCKYFFNGKEKSLEECRERLVDHYGEWAGLAQLYMFDWMRKVVKKS